MKNILILIVIITSYFMVGCGNCGCDTQEYTYKWQVEVTFLDGTVKIMDVSMETYKGMECMLELTDTGSLRGTLKEGSLHHNLVFANGVRTFKLLSEEKIELNPAINFDSTHTQIPQQ
jgi:hypothetical protein